MTKKIFLISTITLLSAGGVGVYVSTKNKEPSYDFTIAQRGDVIQEVSVTGRVKPSENADLAFETGGKISTISVKVGDMAEPGQELAAIDSTELITKMNQARADLDYANAQLTQARVAADIEKIKLGELKRGTREEEIQIAQTKASNAQKALDDAEVNLVNVQSKADADLREDYNSALNAITSSVTVAMQSLFVLTDIQSQHFYGSYQTDIKIYDAKAAAILSLLGEENAGRASNDQISQMNGGAKQAVETAQLNSSYENLDKALTEVKDALQKINSALNLVPTDRLTYSQKSDLDAEKNNINGEITAISGKQQTIEVQKAANASSLAAAQSKTNDAKNALLAANDELALKLAGTTPEQIEAQEFQVEKANANITSQIAQVGKARASVENIRAQIEKTVIRSPIKGVVARQDARIGEIVPANQIIVSIISAGKFEIEANVAEVDIAKISAGNPASVTLDAYSNDTEFYAEVLFIDPAETFIDGIPTYKITIVFGEESELVKSGMTANVTILTDRRDNVISIPQRAVIQKNGDKIVRILDGDAAVEKIVSAGLRGSDGNIEIVSGINEGEKVITFIDEGK